MNIILASASPRRQELLRQMGLEFQVCVADVDETLMSDASPRQEVERLSREKAFAVSGSKPGSIIIAADTVVVVEGKILGKPKNRDHALKMLMSMSGRAHEVYTGVTVTDGQKTHIFSECSRVEMIAFDEQTACNYIDTGEPNDKAGAYGIQGKGGMLISAIYGDYYNIVGLPICKLRQVLRDFDITTL